MMFSVVRVTILYLLSSAIAHPAAGQQVGRGFAREGIYVGVAPQVNATFDGVSFDGLTLYERIGGTATVGQPVFIIRHADGKRVRAKITKVFEFTGLGTRETESAVAGNIVGLSGFEDIDIGDTLTADEAGHALPFTQIDPPTLEMQFCVNDGPLVGKEGKLVTSRQLRERLMRELKTNVSIHIEDSDKAGIFSNCNSANC